MVFNDLLNDSEPEPGPRFPGCHIGLDNPVALGGKANSGVGYADFDQTVDGFEYGHDDGMVTCSVALHLLFDGLNAIFDDVGEGLPQLPTVAYQNWMLIGGSESETDLTVGNFLKKQGLATNVDQ